MPSIIISSPGAVSITSYKIITFLFESTSVIFFAKPNDINKGIDYINRFTGYKEGIEKNGIHAIHLEYQPQPKIVNMSLYNENFDYIKNGTKRIEIRLNDEKRKTICVGDYIEFENLDTKEKLMVRVVALLNYKTIENLINDYKIELLLDKGISKEELINIFNNIYSNEDQYKYKILGIKFEIVK